MTYPTVKIRSQSRRLPQYQILMIYTGGTLGMAHDQDGLLRPFNFEGIIDEMPALKNMPIELTVISFKKPFDSSNVTLEHWNELARIIETYYDQYHGFVVLHGTDTMAYSASALSFMLQGLGKPVIFTGAQLPIGAARTDAGQNLIAALQIASAEKDRVPLITEVCIYFDYLLLRGNRSKKVESAHFDAFESENYPPLAEVGISIEYNHAALTLHPDGSPLKVHQMKPTELALIKLFPGISENTFLHVLDTPHLQGIVLETFGSGNAPTAPWFRKALGGVVDRGVVVYNVSQCNGGKVVQGRYATSKHLEELGVVSGADITTEAALAKMQFLFSIGAKMPEIKRTLTTPLRGEMD